VLQDLGDDRLDRVLLRAVDAHEPGLGRGVERLGDEEAPQLPDQERGVVAVREHDVDDVAPVVLAALAEDLLDAGVVELAVVAGAAEAAVPPLGLEAGERAGRLADVLLRVALAQAEELHELAGVVLVGRPLGRLEQRQEQAHRVVGRDLARERLEVAEGVLTQLAVLREHQRRLLVARREVVVPEERHLLDQRALRADHPVEPPQPVVAPLVDRIERAVLGARSWADQIGAAAAVQQPGERRVLAGLRPLGDLVRTCAEAGAPHDASYVCLGPLGSHPQVHRLGREPA
jgi:hypothetical protein